LRSYKDVSGNVSKKDAVWLRSCLATASGSSGLSAARLRVGRSAAEQITANRHLRRSRGLQGPPVKCGILREELYAWFVDIRGSLATTISPKFMLLKARQLADMIVWAQLESDAFEAMPKINADWLLRFKRDYNIVLRKPNVRFKCNKATLHARVKATWSNVLRVRCLAQELLGVDLGDRIYGIDEKPIHFNESGSKATRIGTCTVKRAFL
jgi:hypothetical protein